jgi:carboxymethylenebutenolidase
MSISILNSNQTIRLFVLSMLICIWHFAGFPVEQNNATAAEGSEKRKSVKVAIDERSKKQSTFTSGGRRIRTEWFYAATGASAPTVIMLPGSGGVEDTGGFFRDMAHYLSNNGINAVIVRYMDRSGINTADGAQMGANFGKWFQTVHDAVKFVQYQPGVDSKRVSILGHSLGSQLALHAAASDPSIVSVVDMAGCFVLPTGKISHMPPVLILHGSADSVVPLRRERQMVTVLKRVGARYQEHIFKNADHAFANVSEEDLFRPITNFLKTSL